MFWSLERYHIYYERKKMSILWKAYKMTFLVNLASQGSLEEVGSGRRNYNGSKNKKYHWGMMQVMMGYKDAAGRWDFDKIQKYVKGEISTLLGFSSLRRVLLYRVCDARQKFEDEEMQLILPVPCREKVLKLAHTIPLAGHLGQRKTVIKQRCVVKFRFISF